jgi:hypothetical protein
MWHPYLQDHATRLNSLAAGADWKLAFDESLQMGIQEFNRDV